MYSVSKRTRVWRYLEFGNLPSCVLNEPDWRMRQILGMMQNEADLRMCQNQAFFKRYEQIRAAITVIDIKTWYTVPK